MPTRDLREWAEAYGVVDTVATSAGSSFRVASYASNASVKGRPFEDISPGRPEDRARCQSRFGTSLLHKDNFWQYFKEIIAEKSWVSR